MSLTAERFLQGMTPAEHMARMKINSDRFRQVLGSVEIPPEDRAYFANLPAPLRVAVFTEDWCGDHVTTTPVVYRLAEEPARLEVRVFMRNQDPDLANSFLPGNRHGTVPVFVFFDAKDMREVGRFIETARELVPVLDGMEEAIRRAHPEIPDINGDVSGMSESTRSLLRQERSAFRVSHAREWGRVISRGFRDVVAAGMSRSGEEGPAEGRHRVATLLSPGAPSTKTGWRFLASLIAAHLRPRRWRRCPSRGADFSGKGAE